MNRRTFFKESVKRIILPSIGLLGLGSILNRYGNNVARASDSNNSCGGSCSGKCTKTCANDCTGGSYWAAE